MFLLKILQYIVWNRQPTAHAADDPFVGPIVDIDTCFDTVDHFSVDVSTSGRDWDVRNQAGRVDVGAEIVDAGRVVVNVGLVFQAVFAEKGHVSKVAALGMHTVASTNLEIKKYLWYHYMFMTFMLYHHLPHHQYLHSSVCVARPILY